MSDPLNHGTLTQTEGRPTLVFNLTLDHPIDIVWAAVSQSKKLEQFFPAAVSWTPSEGESFDLGGAELIVTDVQPPVRLAWVTADQAQSFELADAGGQTELTFTHVIDDMPPAQTATGWEIYLSRLAPLLDGSPISEQEAHAPWERIHERYAEQFGVDPEPGRRWAAENLPI